ncbi:hypothetical protein ACNKHO_17280 [Shigella flexneri]
MSKLDLNALNELPKVDRVLALAETNASWKSSTPKGVWPGRWKICPVNMYSLQALGFRRR